MLVDAFCQRDSPEHSRAIVGVQSVLIAFSSLSFLDQADVDEFVQVIVECTTVDLDHLPEFCGTHLTGVDESVADLVASTVSDGSVHREILVQREDAVVR